MGLAEKRWVQERKKTDETALQSQVNSATESYGLPQLVKALQQVTVDELGKEAIKSGLKKIVVKPAAAEAVKFDFADGTITWNAYFGSSSGGYIYADAMQKTIEKAL